MDTHDGCRVPGKPIHERGRSLPGDPPGSMRLRVIDPNRPSDDDFPRGPRNGVIAGAAIAVLTAFVAL